MDIRVRTVGELKSVLASSNLPPESLPVYYMMDNPRENITVLLPQMLDREFPKTYGHYHVKQSEEIYQILFGEGLVLLQRKNSQGELTEVNLVTAFKGEIVNIPGDCGHALINIGSSPLITIDNYDPKKEIHDYDSITAKHGLGYYIISDGKDGWKAIPNLNYLRLPILKC